MERLQKKSESLFREFCDNNGIAYFYIDQEKKTFSSKIWKSKRPDYIVSLPSIGSIFVDVKAQEDKLFWHHAFEELDETPPLCHRFDLDEVKKFLELEKETMIKLWYAVYITKDGTVTDNVGFIPNDRVAKFIMKRHKEFKSWNYLQVPFRCFNEMDTLTYNNCADCEDKFCEKLEKYLEIEDKIHGTFKKDSLADAM